MTNLTENQADPPNDSERSEDDERPKRAWSKRFHTLATHSARGAAYAAGATITGVGLSKATEWVIGVL